MLDFKEIFLVRHGSYIGSPDGDNQKLTELGEAEARRAGANLVKLGVGSTAVLLSSNMGRAMQSAKKISDATRAQVVESKRINIIGNEPEGVESLDAMLEAALEEEGQALQGDHLVVVTHEPLMKIATFGGHIANGEIIKYEPGSWVNPKFSEFHQLYLGTLLKGADLAASVSF